MHALTLDHATIRTARIAETIEFYARFFGLKPGLRPPIRGDGAWLYPDGGDYPILHIIEDDEDAGQGGMFDHIAFRSTGLLPFLDKLRAEGQPFEARPIPETPFTQVHLYDPNGIKLEMTFEEKADDASLACPLAQGEN